MKHEGYIVEYDAEFLGGPADGLQDSVISIDKQYPPKFTFFEIGDDEITPVSIGQKFIKSFLKTCDETKVAVYQLENPETYDDDDETILPYKFIETTNYSTFQKNY